MDERTHGLRRGLHAAAASPLVCGLTPAAKCYRRFAAENSLVEERTHGLRRGLYAAAASPLVKVVVGQNGNRY